MEDFDIVYIKLLINNQGFLVNEPKVNKEIRSNLSEVLTVDFEQDIKISLPKKWFCFRFIPYCQHWGIDSSTEILSIVARVYCLIKNKPMDYLDLPTSIAPRMMIHENLLCDIEYQTGEMTLFGFQYGSIKTIIGNSPEIIYSLSA